jgi:hypothetical protein
MILCNFDRSKAVGNSQGLQIIVIVINTDINAPDVGQSDGCIAVQFERLVVNWVTHFCSVHGGIRQEQWMNQSIGLTGQAWMPHKNSISGLIGEDVDLS